MVHFMLSWRGGTAMNVSIGVHWEKFVEGLVKSGRYGSASEVIRDARRRVEAREEKLDRLRGTLKAPIDEDDWYSADEAFDHSNSTLQEDGRAMEPKPKTGAELWQRIRNIVEPVGGIELDIPPRRPLRRPRTE